jgi:hypothetical protein
MGSAGVLSNQDGPKLKKAAGKKGKWLEKKRRLRYSNTSKRQPGKKVFHNALKVLFLTSAAMGVCAA